MSEYIACDRVDFAPGDSISSQYSVDKMLGEGTFGRVYKVHSYDGSVYALKLLKLWEVMVEDRASLLKRFDREYETGKISSNYLVHSLGKGIANGNPFIVMEFCGGGDLMSAAERGNVDIASVGVEVLYGLRDLHNNGKIHRDLKPENVLIRDDGTAVLTDFGIAGDQTNRLTQRGIFGDPLERFGTYAYMPPEQVNPPRKRNATVLPTTDIFSFGVMMYQLLTYEFPFGPLECQNDLAVYTANGKNGKWNRQLLSQRAPAWMDIIEGCLQPKIENRFQSVDDVLARMPQGTRRSNYRRSFSADMQQPQFNIVNGVQLRVMQGEQHGMVYKLNDMLGPNGRVLLMGRASYEIANNIPIQETESCYVSRCHCTIEYDQANGMWMIRDGQCRINCQQAKRWPMPFPCPQCPTPCHPASRPRFQWGESLNGTFLNSTEVSTQGMYFKPGDIISIGDVKMRVEGY